MESYNIIGLMSGTSADGLDVVLCRFDGSDYNWKYMPIKAKTYEYDSETKAKMLSLHTLSAEDLKRADVWFGNFSADAINEFRKDIAEHIDLVASHGHTVFHNPSEGYTMQIGDGNVIAKKT
ncbi:MAG: anhydro-N-acetylmuramic acid kinase, partial [Bacteroidales bacterium]|nr:anhydro-N-acetylmuramic acid kinase [Bacteroidales bacterium]